MSRKAFAAKRTSLDALQTQRSTLDSLHARRCRLADSGYEADFAPLFCRATKAAQERLHEDPQIIAGAGAFHFIDAPLRETEQKAGGVQRPPAAI